MIQLPDLLSLLGYSTSPHYRRNEEEFEPEAAHLFRSARRAGVDGAYVFRASASRASAPLAARPAVFVAAAETEDQAHMLHRRMWNLGSAPFLVVVLPGQIKIYTAFQYGPKSEKGIPLSDRDRGLLHTLYDDRNIPITLRDFTAEAIDNGRIWDSADYRRRVDSRRRVDIRLLANLSLLDSALQLRGLAADVAHALIGKYVYIRYLRDRNILSDEWLTQHGIDRRSVFEREAKVEELARLVGALEQRFNGRIFPVDLQGDRAPTDNHVGLTASVFMGDEIMGQESGEDLVQLHMDFQAYQFDYIPIETLSSVYEQFIDQRMPKGAVYTPEVLADYLLSEMNAIKALTPRTIILDPACGSGVFLVLALRRLIEQELAEQPDGRISPETLADLLSNLYGVERELDACYVTEFSLLLTILHYIDPPELHKHPHFQFPSLHNKQIFRGDFFDDSLDLWQRGMRFDWIIGNPPWVNAERNDRHGVQLGAVKMLESIDQQYAAAWIEANASQKPVGDRNVAEAFSWHIGAALADDGLAGLIMPATSLINVKSRKYRSAFFTDHQVFRITNFANLRRFLFGSRVDGTRVEAPAATIVYTKAPKDGCKPDIVHYGPFSINQVPHLGGSPWAITINEDEVHTISCLDAEKGETTTWKLALWGSHNDKRALELLVRLFPTTLQQYCEQQGWGTGLPQEGVQLRAIEGAGTDMAVELPSLINTKVFSLDQYKNGPRFRFWLPDTLLQPNEKRFIRKRGGATGLRINNAPHILISTGWDFVFYSDQDFIVPPRQIGVSAVATHRLTGNALVRSQRRLKALCMYLNSTLVRYYLFFHVPQWGINSRRDSVVVSEVREIPTPDFTDSQIDLLATLHGELSQAERNGYFHPFGFSLTDLHKAQQEQLDRTIFELFKVPEDIRTLSTDFVHTRLMLNQDKAATLSVTRRPTNDEFSQYAEELQRQLDDFLMGENRPNVEITWSDDLTECIVELPVGSNRTRVGEVSVRQGDMSRAKLLGSISDVLRRRISQWVYVRRGLRLYDGPCICLYKPTRLIGWTRTQAMSDAADIIAYSIQGGSQQ